MTDNAKRQRHARDVHCHDLDWLTVMVAAIGWIVLCGGTVTAADSGQTVAQDTSTYSGVWSAEKPTATMLTTEGKVPPLKPAAAKIYNERLAARRAGDTSFDRATWCASPGMPRFMFMPLPFEIVVNTRRIAFLYSWSNWSRLVDMSGATLDVIYPITMGTPMGHWDGNTLVIDTIGLSDATILDGSGLPHSENMKLTEHLRLLSKDVLEDRFTIDDPATFTRPWDAVMTYRRQVKDVIKENVCLDRIKAGEPAIAGE